MIEVKPGVLFNPNLILCVKMDSELKNRLTITYYGRDNSLEIQCYYYDSKTELVRIYEKFLNSTQRVYMTNTVTTSEERHWDL